MPHHLVDVREPWESASVAWWLEQAAACTEIESRGKQVLFVGGTPLYLKALLCGLFDGPPADAEIRRKLTEEAETARRRAYYINACSPSIPSAPSVSIPTMSAAWSAPWKSTNSRANRWRLANAVEQGRAAVEADPAPLTPTPASGSTCRARTCTAHRSARRGNVRGRARRRGAAAARLDGRSVARRARRLGTRRSSICWMERLRKRKRLCGCRRAVETLPSGKSRGFGTFRIVGPPHRN